MPAKYKTYSEYKDSGVEWLGDIPTHWNTIPVGRLFNRIKRTNYIDKELLSVYRDYGVIIKSTRDDNNNKASEDLTPYQLVEPDDLVMNKMKAWQGSIAISEHEGIVSPAYFVYKPWAKFFDIAYSKYVHYLLRNPIYIGQYLRQSKGIRINQWDLDPYEFQRIELLLPTKEEQIKIFQFLDHETGKIDELIEKQKRLIELLKEKRQAVISHAVTKGLNPNAPMKDSGVEWLGVTPAHWEMKKLKYIGKARNGLTYAPEDIVDEGEGILVLRSSNVQNAKIAFDDNVFVSKNIQKTLITKEDDILICSRNGSRALIGKNALIDRDSSGLSYGAFMMLYRSEINPYLFCVFNSMLFDYQSGTFLTSTINQLTVGNINSFEIPIPPIDERIDIIKYIKQKSNKLDALISKAETAITLMQERRTALISAAVTGKIDVRDWQAPEKSSGQKEELKNTKEQVA